MLQRLIHSILLMIAFVIMRPVHSQSTLNAEHNYALNCPGIVMVQSVFSATVYVNKVDINERMFEKLVDSVKRLDTTGHYID